MAGTRLPVPLKHGLKIGETVYKDVVLREATAGDILDAQEEAERLMLVPNDDGGVDPMLIASPSRVGVEVLRRQIVSIGDVSGPLDLKLLRRLEPEDLNLLLGKSEQLDGAAVESVQEGAKARGRDPSDRPATTTGDVGDRDAHGVE